MPTLLSEADQSLFDNKIYSVYRRLNNSGISYHLDFADYDAIKSKYTRQIQKTSLLNTDFNV